MVSKQVANYLCLLRFVSSLCSADILLMAHSYFIISNLTYESPIWGQSLRIIFNKSNKQTCREILRENVLLRLPSIYIF